MPLAKFAPFALLQRTLSLVSLALLAVPVATGVAAAQVKQPSVQGTAVADPAIPALISVPTSFSTYFVLNKDLSLLTHSSDNVFVNKTCVAPSGLSASSTAPRSQINDNSFFYVTAQSSTASSIAAVAVVPGTTCAYSAPVALAGGIPTQTLTSNDRGHGRYFVVNAFASAPDTITVFNNLNTNTSSTPSLSQLARTSLDSGATYTSIVTDTRSTYGLTAITEAKTATSPGNLWIYSPGIQTAFKILSPTGDPLPATSSFLIPSPNDGGGAMLVLVNQDGLTATNQSAPPQVTSPFTIIDLGQLQRAFSAVVASGTTIKLPFVTQVPATASYYAMLGAAYNPVNHLAYALVAGGTSSTSVTQSIISYDVTNPTAPNETIVADVSSIPFTFGALPQLALNAVSGTLQILTSTSAVYSVGITGTGNIPVAVTGTVFPDSNFQPTYIAANPLMGETYIASASGQVDILTKPASAPYAATVTMSGPDNAISGQSYSLTVTSNSAFYDLVEIAAPLTITATPAGGTPYTFATGTVGAYADCNCNVSGTFPAAGVYTLVATAPATANYAAITSNPVVVTVGATSVTGVYTTGLTLSVPSTSTSTSVNASVTLAGSTYAPTGRIVVSDANGEVGRLTLSGGILSRPATIPLTLVNGTSTLTAVYNGDSQNKASTSPAITVTTGNKVTPALALTVPSSGTPGGTLQGNIAFNTTSTTVPTGNIIITALASGSTTPITLATVSAASAFAQPFGVPFSFTAPTAGSYVVSANYAGDANYSAAPPSSPPLVISGSSTITTTLNISAPSSPTAGVNFTALITLKSATTGSTPPSGNVTLTATPTAGGTPTSVTYTAAQAYASGGYAAQVSLTAAGTYTLTAAYAGDSTYAASTGSVTVTVTAPPPVTPTISLSVGATATSGTTQIGSISYDFSGSTATATGNILILATSSTGATTTLATIAASQTKGHLLTAFSFTAPAGGTYAVIARYAGDSAFNPADSNTVTLAVTTPGFTATAISLSAPASASINNAFTVTVRLTSTTVPPAAPSGNIVVTARLAGGAATTVATIPATQAIATGGTTASVTLPTAGSYALTATYAGDSSYGASTGSIGVTVTLPPTTITFQAASNTTVGTPITIVGFLNIGPGGSRSDLIGNVVITSSSGSIVGPTASLSAASLAANVNGVSTTLTFTAAGTYIVTGSYPGDSVNGPSTVTPITIVVTSPTSGTPSFSMALDDPTVGDANPLNVQNIDDVASTTVTLKAFGGFTTPLTLGYDASTISSKVFVAFKDDSGRVITQITPSTAGIKVNVVVSGRRFYGFSHPMPPGSGVPVTLAGGLMGLMLLKRRNLSARARRTFRVIHSALIVGVVCTTMGAYSESCLGNCDDGLTAFLKVTATPTNTTQASAPQSVIVKVYYTRELE